MVQELSLLMHRVFSDLIKMTSIPVVYAHSACDIYNLKNHMSIGSIEPGASRAGNFTLQNSDLLL